MGHSILRYNVQFKATGFNWFLMFLGYFIIIGLVMFMYIKVSLYVYIDCALQTFHSKIMTNFYNTNDVQKLTRIDICNLRADPNPVIQRALKVLADSHDGRGRSNDFGRIIIYKPTYRYARLIPICTKSITCTVLYFCVTN